MSKINVFFAAMFLVILGAANAFAVDFYTAPTIDTAVLGTMATSILAALALLWAVRKGVKMINRS